MKTSCCAGLWSRVLGLAGFGVLVPAVAAKDLAWSKRHLLIGPHENAAVADFNRDGHLDIVSGPQRLLRTGFSDAAVSREPPRR